ncbi:MAG: DMT family transporter [Paenibacillaceae bacterium]
MIEFYHQLNKEKDSSRWLKWYNHRMEISNLISNTLAYVGDRENVIIFGAGNCDDLNLSYFTDQFRYVWLADIDLPSMKDALKNIEPSLVNQLQLITTDFTKLVWMSWTGNSLLSNNTLGNLLIAIGYVGWATENNLGRLLGENIPTVTLVCIKALVAGVVMGILSLAFGETLVVWRVVPGIFASGAVSLGLSLALFYSAMRHIGAGRTGLVSSTSTLWGVLGAVFLLGEALTGRIVIGGLFMLIGIIIFAWETNIEKSVD